MFDETNLRNAHKGAVIIAIADLLSLAIYAGLAEFFLEDIDMFPQGEFSSYSTFRFMVVAVSAAIIILMVILRNKILSGKIKISSQPPASSEETSHQPGIKKDAPEANEGTFINRLRAANIISYALCGSIAVFGLLLFIMGKDKTEFYAFLGVSLFLMLVHFPKYDDWKSRLEDFLSDY